MSETVRDRISRYRASVVHALRAFFKHLADILFPTPQKKICPHCGGIRCFGICGLPGEKDDDHGAPLSGTPDSKRGG